jgi:hypothetical protein
MYVLVVMGIVSVDTDAGIKDKGVILWRVAQSLSLQVAVPTLLGLLNRANPNLLDILIRTMNSTGIKFRLQH